MRDKINSDRCETSSSMLPHSNLPIDGITEDVMSLSSLTAPGFSQSGKRNVSSITECAVSTSICGVVTPEPGDRDSDAVWVAMQKQQNQAIAYQASGWTLFRLGTTDPHRDGVAEADRKGFFDLLRKSYARRADTIVWSMIVFILAAIVLIPLLGFSMGPAFAALVSLCWTAVHRVRRL